MKNQSKEVKMRRKELKRLKRVELLELLVEQTNRVKELEMRLAEAEAKLENRKIIMEESGSLAEAVLKLNDIFEVAQVAANQYLENVIRKTEIEMQRNAANEKKETVNPL